MPLLQPLVQSFMARSDHRFLLPANLIEKHITVWSTNTLRLSSVPLVSTKIVNLVNIVHNSAQR
jgi:hypothetical protein